jgi:hypothetical protein
VAARPRPIGGVVQSLGGEVAVDYLDARPGGGALSDDPGGQGATAEVFALDAGGDAKKAHVTWVAPRLSWSAIVAAE